MTLRAPERRAAVVSGVVVANLALVAAVWFGAHVDQHRGPADTRLPGWVLAVMFLVTEAVVLHVQVRREAQAVSLSEIPLVLGLVYADPLALLVARLLASSIVMVGVRRQPPLKLAYNLSMQAAEVSLALVVFRDVAPTGPGLDPLGVTGVYAGVLAAAVLTGFALRTVIGVSDGTISWRGYLAELVDYPPIAFGTATLGFVAAYALQDGFAGTWALLLTLAGLLCVYRFYGRLRRRHESLERLFGFTQSLPDAGDAASAQVRLLEPLRALFQAEFAALVLEDDTGADAEIAVDVEHASSGAADRADALLLHGMIRESGQPRVWPATRFAHGHPAPPIGRRDVMATPVRDGDDVLGTLIVADRLGAVQTFTNDDLQLLQTVAAHASASVRNAQLVDRLRYDASHDQLTGLANRVAWERLAHRVLAARDATAGAEHAVVLVDLDGFKDVNDTLGHHHGDDLLVEVAQRLGHAVGDDAAIARFGGDEFAILVPHASRDKAVRVAQAVTSAMHEPVLVGHLQVEVQASVGLALAPMHGTDLATLLKRADLAMYSSKSTNARVTVFDERLEDSGPNRLALVADLRRALQDGAVNVVVQPKAVLATGQVTGVEVLARWEHPVQGAIPPNVFIPLAERSGLIREITETTLDQALGLCRGWLDEGQEISVAVNLSPRSLLDDDLLQLVATSLRRHRVPPQLLTLEITESSVIADPDGALVALGLLRQAGVRLSVDDFGTGYSSLSYLKRLPVQEVKIDRSFVRDLVHDRDDEVIVRAVADLGRSLELEVVAEGVEDLATWRRLHDLGCTTVQGYHLCRPVRPGHFLTWLAQHRAALAAATPMTAHPAADSLRAAQALGRGALS